MRRTGGDGSGDFVIYNTYSAGGSAAAGLPYKGSKMTIALADGSVSYANIMPEASGTVNNNPIAYGTQNYFYGGGFGPTANGMMCGLLSSGDNESMWSTIWNINNGKILHYAYLTKPAGIGSFTGTSSTYALYWRGKIFLQTYGYGYGAMAYDQADLENWLDEVGVFYGLL